VHRLGIIQDYAGFLEAYEQRKDLLLESRTLSETHTLVDAQQGQDDSAILWVCTIGPDPRHLVVHSPAAITERLYARKQVS
jgi:hypothetical protein